MATKTNTGLVAYAKAQVGLPYWYGTFGQTASQSLYESKAKQYEKLGYYTKWTDYGTQYGLRVHDCVGLIKGYLWSASATATPVYNSEQDKSAIGMYNAADDDYKGAISTFPKTAGLLVFKGTAEKTIHHVGVYGGDGYVYEAKGHEEGVVKTAYKSSDWQFWAQCPYTTNDVSESSTASVATASTSKYSTLQSASKYTAGYSSGKKYKTTGRVNLRYGASTDYSVITTIPKSGVVTWYGYYNVTNGLKWYKVKYGDKTGYISTKYIEAV